MQWGLDKVCYLNLMKGVGWRVERFKGNHFNEIQQWIRNVTSVMSVWLN